MTQMDELIHSYGALRKASGKRHTGQLVIETEDVQRHMAEFHRELCESFPHLETGDEGVKETRV